MPTYEHNTLQQHVDQNGDLHIDYPITKAENVVGLYGDAALTGVPTAPTPASGTNTTQIATTEFVQTEIADLKKSASDGMTLVANAITGKGVTTATDATAETMAENIASISAGINTSDADAAANMIAKGQTAYVNGVKVTGTLGTAQTLIGTNFVKRTVTGLSAARMSLAGATNGIYALFAGGTDGSNSLSRVDAYDGNLSRVTATSLSVARCTLVGAKAGNYALFAGGQLKFGSSASSATVDAYSNSLVRSIPEALSLSKYNLASTTFGNYALFAGGSMATKSVDAYNSSLTRSTPTELSVFRGYLAGASNDKYALFAGGIVSSYSNVVDAYNSSLTRSTPTVLSVARAAPAGAKAGIYALFAGGNNGSRLNTVDAYNNSLVRSTPTALSVARDMPVGCSVTSRAIFATDYNSSTALVDTYNGSLTRSSAPDLDLARSLSSATTTNGVYAIFAGGNSKKTSTIVNTVDAYMVERIPAIKIPETTIYL